MIGRIKEVNDLNRIFASKKSEFVAIYGRRRVGKTYLVRELFGNRFAFSYTGIIGIPLSRQLAQFHKALQHYGCKETRRPIDWFEAFDRLQKTLEASSVRRKIIFIDELPWLDTPKSNFLPALGAFWNSWCDARKDILLIVCGSASSWIVNKLFRNRGALHNRVTWRIKLLPFTLGECERLTAEQGITMSRTDIAECYMAVGGIPYYWNYLSAGNSLAQNFNEMFFAEGAPLKNEFRELFASLFKNSDLYTKIAAALARKKGGMTRSEIVSAVPGLPMNGKLTEILDTLEESGFVRTVPAYGNQRRGSFYQLIDNFTLFHFSFLSPGKASSSNPDFWQSTFLSPALNTWRGLSFERLCLQHIEQIKKALGISGVYSIAYAWRHEADECYPKGVQIDLVLDRADRIVNVCEMKFTSGPYAIDKSAAENLRAKVEAFAAATKTRKGIQLVVISAEGLAKTMYSGMINRSVTLDDLFSL